MHPAPPPTTPTLPLPHRPLAVDQLRGHLRRMPRAMQSTRLASPRLASAQLGWTDGRTVAAAIDQSHHLAN